MSAIRLQRDRVHRATDAVIGDQELGRRIRRAPVPWLLGAGLLGVVAGSLVLPPVLRAGRHQFPGAIRHAVRGRVRTALGAAAVTLWGRVAAGFRGDGSGASARAPSARSNGGPDATDPHLSTPERTS